MKGVIKASTADKYLTPLRSQIVDLVKPNTTVVDFGCGSGDLLFKLSNKITCGIGIDKSENLISYASKRAHIAKFQNLEFRISDIVKEPLIGLEKNYSIASLLFHVLDWEASTELLKKIISISETTIICGFCKPNSFKQNLLLWLDQRFTAHYSNYKNYSRKGFTEGLLNSIENIKYDTINTFDSCIKIYVISKFNL
ncbi:methyltransferase domain-containing protein [Seonamhaeicola sediminis]|uniref:Methyltransferase domain-containing protein n=1 Tax=Seonamhaeicola sediminis TaxID=2528206 RepID=A0A562YHA8_9FLAO|nr:methyltransferase domain-containing protein [Seonamhaeicola sediminis]TWO33906.1 methyltransferase domain-containing protein [Seonamhaeicola sediminis]